MLGEIHTVRVGYVVLGGLCCVLRARYYQGVVRCCWARALSSYSITTLGWAYPIRSFYILGLSSMRKLHAHTYCSIRIIIGRFVSVAAAPLYFFLCHDVLCGNLSID
eukprot:1078397-Pyramimonas_sp.AAC.1